MSILNNQKNNLNKTYLAVSILGKSLNLNIKYRNNPIVELDKQEKEIILYLPKKYKSIENINIINMAIEKMYDEIAEIELDNSMEKIRLLLGFAPEDYIIERMFDSFYKIKGKIVIINPDIVKYNKKIIETTLIQAFCKTRYKANSKVYKSNLKKYIEQYESLKYQFINKKKVANRVKKVS